MKTDEEWAEFVDDSIRRAVAFYDESLDKRFGQVLEAADYIKVKLEDMVTHDEFNDLRTEVTTIRLAVTDTNKDLKKLTKSAKKLENTVYHA